MVDRSSDARERVLNVAEQLFMDRGYTAVTLRDIADQLKMRQASLYHHVPGGKEALYVEVMERSLARHQQALRAAIDSAPANLRAQMTAAAGWFMHQPPMNFARITRSDMPALAPEHAQRLSGLMYQALFGPLEEMFRRAHGREPLRSTHFAMFAGMFLAHMEAAYNAERWARVPRTELAAFVIDTLLDGMRAR
jgi:TetR/AcrR family transcriptional regulator, cholesterol catabolism regulator